MPDSTYTELFHFTSAALPPETFHVVRFRGTEGLNRLFSFSIDLVSQDSSVDADKVLDAPALFTIHRQSGGDAVFQGFPARVEQSGHFNGWTYYQVELRPAFWKLTQLVQSAIFLDKTARDAADELLGGQQFFNIPHEFRFTRSDYPAQEFAMQYGESVYDYILWRMEEQGAYFFFAPDGDKIIFADSPQSHGAPSITVSYSPATGLEGEKREEVLTAFTMARTPLPRRVVVRTYDWKDPLKVVLGMADVAAGGMGDVYLTSENVESDAEAERIAKIRAEELICHSRQFSGAGAVPLLRPGLVFTLDRHYNPAFNRGYMVTEITHEGGQEAFLSLGLGIPLRDAAEHLFYRNSFSCIEDDLPYRPARTAPRASIPGVIRAFVDGAGSGARAEMDEYGRYKLIFPFDVSGRKAGNASCWVRMAQPQVGMDHGMSFPLLPGAEVTVAFLNGNPDRPVITGALPNGETGAITGQGNVNFSGIRTPGGNQITFNDTDNKQGISLLSASGLGLSFADGSPNTTALTSDKYFSAAGLGSGDFTGVCKTIWSGFKNASIASNEGKWEKFVSTLIGGFGSSFKSMMNSLSSSAAGDKTYDTTTAWALDGVSLGLDLVSDIIDMVSAGISSSKKKNVYNASISGSADTAASVMQVAPNTAKLIVSIISWFAMRAASIGMTAHANAIATDDANKKDDKEKKAGEEFYKKQDDIGKNKNVQKVYEEAESDYQEKEAAKTLYDNASSAEKKETIETLYQKRDQELEKAEAAFNAAAEKYKEIKNPTDEDKNKYKEAQKTYREAQEKYEAIGKLYDNPANRSKPLEKCHVSEKEYTDAKDKYLGAKDLYDHASDKSESVEDAYKDSQEYHMDYHNTKVHAARRKDAIQQVSAMLPDITAFIVLMIGKTPPDNQVGGVSVSSEKNINITADKTVSLHGQQGIFLNTKPGPPFPTPPWGNNEGKWGIEDPTDAQPPQGYTIGSNNKRTNLNQDFVAVNTTERYVEAEKNEEIYNNSTIIVHNYTATNEKDYVQIYEHPIDAQKTGVVIHGNNIFLEAHTNDLKPSVTVNPDSIELFADSNHSTGISIIKDHNNAAGHVSAALSLRNGNAFFSQNSDGTIDIRKRQDPNRPQDSDPKITISDDSSLTLTPGANQDVIIDKIHITGNKLSAENGGIIDLGDQVKIMGVTAKVIRNTLIKKLKEQTTGILAAQRKAKAAQRDAHAALDKLKDTTGAPPPQ